ncbi:MAG: TetR/AcrR family transcriptional regulator [Neoaquamicrobium sediminum]|uniref:TetR/AcrR family transcriptional regulator n=1 Tax=Neoaquamicrobium sediminum TaxID=1849104 RepID=UPI0040356648
MPADAQETKVRILNAAERLFAENGYDKVTLRGIAKEADAHLALIKYHFGTKDDLYRAIWTDRYAKTYGRRFDHLDAIDYSRPREEIVEELAEALLSFMNGLSHAETRRFAHLMAREIADPHEFERGIIAEFLDPRARHLIGAFRKALPELSLADVIGCYQASTGVMLMYVVGAERAFRLADGQVAGDHVTSALPVLRQFIVGGWLALARVRAQS